MKDLYRIVGAGPMGRLLARHLESEGLKVEVFDSGHSCALNSMPFVSLFGIEEGKSELGNLLYKSYHAFDLFYQKVKPKGVLEVEHYILYRQGEEKYEKRFGLSKKINFKNIKIDGEVIRSYLIEPSIFLEEIYPSHKIKQKFILDTDIKNDETYKLNFVCGSSLSKNLWEENGKCKIVAGAYLEGTLDLGEKPFIFSSEQGNFIYHSISKRILIGATTEAEEFCLPNLKKLEGTVNFYKLILPEIESVELSLSIGLRLKGKKRMPRFQKVEDRLYLIDSFYKNGWSLPFLFLDKVTVVLS